MDEKSNMDEKTRLLIAISRLKNMGFKEKDANINSSIEKLRCVANSLHVQWRESVRCKEHAQRKAELELAACALLLMPSWHQQ